MQAVFDDIRDDRLPGMVGAIKKDWNDRLVPRYLDRIRDKFPEYDSDFLWLLMHQSTTNEVTCRYLEANYIKYKKKLNILDSGFASKLVSKGNFQARVWEMIVCDMAASIGALIAKEDAGPDIKTRVDGKDLLIEAVTLNEASDENLRTIKPTYDDKGFFSHSGNVDNLELPVVLRFIRGLDDKAKDHVDIDSPLIIAINTGKVVNMTSYDEYVLRLSLFGLGCETITLNEDQTTSRGLQHKPFIEKGTSKFLGTRFWSDNFSHVSGVMYSSQQPLGLVPNSYGWHNSGVYYVPNPNAKRPININPNFLHKMIVTESQYYQVEASEKWQSTLHYG